MVRSFLYLIILAIVVFIPFNITKNVEKKSVKKASKSISIKLVEPKVIKKKPSPPKISKPKLKPKPKPKRKKVVKKKILKKKKVVQKKRVPKPSPLPQPVEKPVIQEKKKEIIEPVIEPIVEEEPVVQTQTAQANNTSKLDAYFALIYEEIDRKKHYPKKSRRFRQEDTIPVSFTIDATGRVSAFKIVKRSEYRELNKAVKKMFQKIKKFAKPPQGAKPPLEVTIKINFTLEG